jgi:hypothetical protein
MSAQVKQPLAYEMARRTSVDFQSPTSSWEGRSTWKLLRQRQYLRYLSQLQISIDIACDVPD